MRKVAWTTRVGGKEKKYNLAKEGSETRAEEDERGKKEGRKLLIYSLGIELWRERKREFSFSSSSPLIVRWDLPPPPFFFRAAENPGTDRRKKREKKRSGIRSLLLLSFPPLFLFRSYSAFLEICVLMSSPPSLYSATALGRKGGGGGGRHGLLWHSLSHPSPSRFIFQSPAPLPPLLRLLLATTPGTSIPSPLRRRRPLTCTEIAISFTFSGDTECSPNRPFHL